MTEAFVEAVRVAKGVLFDFNGTLSDDEWVLEDAYDAALQSLGLPGLCKGEYETLVGLSDPDIAVKLLRDRSSKDVDALVGRLAEQYRKTVTVSPTITSESIDFVEMLLAEGKRVAVVTGTFRVLMQGGLDQAGLGQIGDLSVAIEDVTNGKPDPEGFLLGAKRTGLPVDKLVGFEDSEAGLRSLNEAGIKAIGIGPHLENSAGLIAHFSTMSEAARAYLDA